VFGDYGIYTCVVNQQMHTNNTYILYPILIFTYMFQSSGCFTRIL